KRAHGLIFVIEKQPYEPEIRLFDQVHEAFRDASKLVFVNKWDVTELTETSDNQQKIKDLIYKSMRKYVKSDDDIIYGSAALKQNNQMVRQEIPQLMQRL